MTGRGADARKDLEQLYKDHPDDRAVRTALAEVRYWQGDLAGAKTLFDLTIKEFDAQEARPRRSDAAVPARGGGAVHVAVRARERLVSRGARSCSRS